MHLEHLDAQPSDRPDLFDLTLIALRDRLRRMPGRVQVLDRLPRGGIELGVLEQCDQRRDADDLLCGQLRDARGSRVLVDPLRQLDTALDHEREQAR
jgi:hypothetical protein